MAPKMPSTYSEADRHWQWPENTWFQARLNSIKAKEQEQRRKSGPARGDTSGIGTEFEAKADRLKAG